MRKIYDKLTKEVLTVGEKTYQELKDSDYWKLRYSLELKKEKEE